MKKIVFCYTIAGTFRFSTDIISTLKREGFEVTIISSYSKELVDIAKLLDVPFRHFNIGRDISLLRDFKCLVELIGLLRHIKPDIVIGATPKAALISMLASRIARIKYRVYHIFGLPYETADGWKQRILLLMEKFTYMLSSHVVCISRSIRDVYRKRFPNVRSKLVDVGLLTVGGVNLVKFNADRFIVSDIKEELKIPKEKIVIGFVARLTNDKGVGDLIEMWLKLKSYRDDIVLLVVGERDSRDSFDQEKLNILFDDQDVFIIGYTELVEKYMAVMDVFVLPSHREGFGNVNVEASAMKLPVVSYNVTGCKDSVKDNYTGYLVDLKDVDTLSDAVDSLLNDATKRELIGSNGRLYVEKYFTRQKVALSFRNFCLEFN
ncbi:glycosyltransferase family 4 protein [Carboxylicivirga marina]|uniref:glycosyltransferase family 4 protein n=1 Tax=Carboxylicivirga marina TaxID=2800988 RepID=UPI002596BBD6|nr:glycosyltransferase family 4 protein [uncultured Carboxylicivirga sp.]